VLQQPYQSLQETFYPLLSASLGDDLQLGFVEPHPLAGGTLSDHPALRGALAEALRREGAGWAEERVRRLGEIAGGEPLRWGALANANPPVLRTHDRYGNSIDEVEFHPAWHELMRLAVAH